MSAVITIDGPSGSGKGTICRLISEATGFALLDSGALYRLTALASALADINTEDSALVAKIASELNIQFVPDGDSTQVLLNDKDVSLDIRKEQVGMLASKVAAYPDVRKALLERQRAFYDARLGLVADGRDMGTVVFPDANLKIFLTASAEERARRRVLQLENSGETGVNYEEILVAIQQRDEQDTNRASAPLVPASDAVVLDSTSLSIEEVKQRILALAADRSINLAN